MPRLFRDEIPMIPQSRALPVVGCFTVRIRCFLTASINASSFRGSRQSDKILGFPEASTSLAKRTTLERMTFISENSLGSLRNWERSEFCVAATLYKPPQLLIQKQCE